MIRTYGQMHRTDKYSQHSSIIWSLCLNGWVFVYKLSGCGFEYSCSHLVDGFFKDFNIANQQSRRKAFWSSNITFWIQCSCNRKTTTEMFLIGVLNVRQKYSWLKAILKSFSVVVVFLGSLAAALSAKRYVLSWLHWMEHYTNIYCHYFTDFFFCGK